MTVAKKATAKSIANGNPINIKNHEMKTCFSINFVKDSFRLFLYTRLKHSNICSVILLPPYDIRITLFALKGLKDDGYNH